jgi:PBSX family phage terminase large subunit
MNAFAAILWEKHGQTWYAAKEYYHSGRDTGIQKTDEEYATDLDAFIEGHERMETIIDPSAASFITLLQKRKNYRVHNANNAVADGIRETATALQNGKIKISPNCKNWIKEASGYVWDDTMAEDRPVKVNDHLMDATRYFVKTKHIARVRSDKSDLYLYRGY